MRSSLTVCCMTSDPGPFVRAALMPWRTIADEIVVCAGGPVGGEDLGCYADVSDRLFVLPAFGHVERHLARLHAECSGDWIMRVDGDEIPSAALVEAIAQAVRDPLLHGAYVPRAHPHPTTEQFIAGQPWWPDFQLRLYRNDGLLRFSGAQHTAAERQLPARLLAEPLYHLSLLLTGLDARVARAERYERLRPGLRAPTGIPANDMLFPERYAWVPKAVIPAEDRRRIDAVLAATGPSRGGGPAPVYVELAEADRRWAQRPAATEAMGAELSMFGPVQPLAPGERREWHVSVRNTGTETWPWDPSLPPYVHLVSRFASPDGGPADGWHVDFFTQWMAPGTESIVAVLPAAPDVWGPQVLEVRVRHGDHGFVGEPLRVAVDVRPGGAAVAPTPQPAAGIGARLRSRLTRPAR